MMIERNKSGRLNAVLIANEVLDAIPTHVVCTREGRVDEIGVAAGARGFERAYRILVDEVDFPPDVEAVCSSSMLRMASSECSSTVYR